MKTHALNLYIPMESHTREKGALVEHNYVNFCIDMHATDPILFSSLRLMLKRINQPNYDYGGPCKISA